MAYSELEIITETEFRHVSNVTLYRYLDEARREWYQYCILIGVEAVLVHIDVDYKKETFQNEKLLIQTWLERVGNTSFTLKQTMVNMEKELIVSAEAVLTTIDRESRQKVAVPDEVRKLALSDSILKF